jgi:hypothetical protein
MTPEQIAAKLFDDVFCGEDELPHGSRADVEARWAVFLRAHIDTLTVAVRALPAQPYTMTGMDTTTDSRMVNRAAVLAILNGETPE